MSGRECFSQIRTGDTETSPAADEKMWKWKAEEMEKKKHLNKILLGTFIRKWGNRTRGSVGDIFQDFAAYILHVNRESQRNRNRTLG